MGINPNGLDGIGQLPTAHLRVWMAGQEPESHYHQAAKNELARRETRTAWIKWGTLAGLAALTFFLSLYSMFVRE
jgi:hypothetical protein